MHLNDNLSNVDVRITKLIYDATVVYFFIWACGRDGIEHCLTRFMTFYDRLRLNDFTEIGVVFLLNNQDHQPFNNVFYAFLHFKTFYL